MNQQSDFISLVIEAFNKCGGEKFDPTNIHNWQIEAIQSVLENETTLVSVKTSGGKSLVYTLVPIVQSIIVRQPRFVMIVSPLIALIKDQMQKSFGFEKCHHIESNSRLNDILKNIERGSLIYGILHYDL